MKRLSQSGSSNFCPELRKNALLISQSHFSNFVPHVITKEIGPSLLFIEFSTLQSKTNWLYLKRTRFLPKMFVTDCYQHCQQRAWTNLYTVTVPQGWVSFNRFQLSACKLSEATVTPFPNLPAQLTWYSSL